MPNHDEQANTSTPSLKASIISLCQTFGATLQDTWRLASLEARLVGISLLLIIGLGIGIIFLILSAWLLGLAAWAAWLVASGWHWSSALLIMMGINLMLALGLLGIAFKYRQNLGFPATRRHFQNYSQE